MITDEQRNFRSIYLNKIGFRSVEEKKSLEMLLKEKPRKKSKLKQFCLSFSVPEMHRNLLWKILLGIIPCSDSLDVWCQRVAVYTDLLRALHILRIIDEKTQKPKIFYAMWLLETKQLKVGYNINVSRNITAFIVGKKGIKN